MRKRVICVVVMMLGACVPVDKPTEQAVDVSSEEKREILASWEKFFADIGVTEDEYFEQLEGRHGSDDDLYFAAILCHDYRLEKYTPDYLACLKEPLSFWHLMVIDERPGGICYSLHWIGEYIEIRCYSKEGKLIQTDRLVGDLPD